MLSIIRSWGPWEKVVYCETFFPRRRRVEHVSPEENSSKLNPVSENGVRAGDGYTK